MSLILDETYLTNFQNEVLHTRFSQSLDERTLEGGAVLERGLYFRNMLLDRLVIYRSVFGALCDQAKF